MAVTHKKLAELLHVSQSTVSKALSGSREVSPELAEKIIKKAAELGYFQIKRERSRSYASVFSPEIAIFVPEIISVYYSDIATRIVEKIKEKNGRSSIYVTGFNTEYTSFLLEKLYDNIKVDGVISLCEMRYNGEVKLPTVSFSRGSNSGICHIESDLKSGMRDALTYLLRHGHSFIGYVGEPLTARKNRLFGELADELSAENSIQSKTYIEDSRFEEIGVFAARKVLAENENERPTAFICAYDEIAIGFMSELSKKGIEVPRDISVIGINDIQAARYSSPPLTTISADNDKAADKAAEIIMRCVSDKHEPMPPSLKIPTKLVVRESVGSAK